MNPHNKDDLNRGDEEPSWKAATAGSKIGRYIIEKIIEDYSYIRYYKVRDENGNHYTASIAHPDLYDLLKTDLYQLPFLKHKYLARTIECFEEKNQLISIHESIVGTDIRSKIKGLKNADIVSCLEIALKIADCLGYLREKGIVHSNLHPGNVILTEYEDIKVLDPISLPPRLMKAALLKKESERIAYYPPETLNDPEPSGKEDIYFFGSLLFLLLTGNDPYDGLSSTKILSLKSGNETSFPKGMRGKVDKDLETLIKLCMEAKTEARYVSFSEIREKLMKSISKYKVNKFRSPSQWKANLVKSIIALVGLGIITALFVLFTGKNDKPGEISAVMQLEAKRTDPWGNIISFWMTDGATVYSNDGFRFLIMPDSDFYFSIINIAPDGRNQSLLPIEKGSVFFHMKKGERRVFPGEKKWYRFDEATGEETIYIVLCAKDWKNFSNIISEKPLSEAANRATAEKIMSLLDDKISPIKIINNDDELMSNPLKKREQSYSFKMKGLEIIVYKMKFGHK
jgi:hypothetical protein